MSKRRVYKSSQSPNTHTLLSQRTFLKVMSDDSYPAGQIGFMVCCKDASRDVSTPLRSWDEKEEEKLCRYYNKEIHRAAFVLPTWVRSALKSVKKD